MCCVLIVLSIIYRYLSMHIARFYIQECLPFLSHLIKKTAFERPETNTVKRTI